MTDPTGGAPTSEDLAEFADVENELDTRWPESRIEPSLSRIAALMDLLGSPQRGYASIHVAGTNGKTSVTRMIDALLTACADWARSLGDDALFLDVHSDNARAEAAYVRNGFVRTGLEMTGPIGPERELRRPL